MIAGRLVLRTAFGWTSLVALALSALTWLSTSVEAVARGAGEVLLAGLAQVPTLLVLLSPLVVLLGTALAAAWMDARGERTALSAMGLGPVRTGLFALALGAAWGLLQLVAADHLHRITEAPSADWVWLEDGTAFRPEDRLAVRARDGLVEGVAGAPSAEAVDAASQQLRPQTASARSLDGDAIPLRLEWHGRRARGVACALLAFLAWLPIGATADRQVLGALAAGLVYLSADATLRAFAAWGHVTPIVGGWSATAGLAVVVAIAAGLRR
jgi:lipopolysaccharide export LptBFGC system permease protein LptF